MLPSQAELDGLALHVVDRAGAAQVAGSFLRRPAVLDGGAQVGNIVVAPWRAVVDVGQP